MRAQICQTCEYIIKGLCYCSPNSTCPNYKKRESTMENVSNLIRISETEDWLVDYDKSRGMYRVSYFEDNHFVDECWFDAYEEKYLECYDKEKK